MEDRERFTTEKRDTKKEKKKKNIFPSECGVPKKIRKTF